MARSQPRGAAISAQWRGRIPFAYSGAEPLTGVLGPDNLTLSGAITGTAPTAGTHAFKDRGRTVNFHPAGGADGVGGVNTQKSSANDVTVFWFGYPQTDATAYLSVINRGQSSDSLRVNVMTGISYIDSSPAQFDALYSPAKTPVPGQFEAIAARKHGANLKAFDWRTKVTAETTGGNGTFRADGSGDYFYVNHNDTVPRGHVHCLLTFAVNGYLSDAEIWGLLNNPRQIFADRKRQIYVSVASGGTTVAVPVGALTLTGHNPTVATSDHKTVSVPAGSLTLSGFAPTVSATSGTTIAVPAGSLTLTGYAPVVVNPHTISIPLATLSMTGYAPTVLAGVTVSVPAGSLALTGYAPTVINPVSIFIPAGGLTLTGFAPTVSNGAGITISVPNATLTLNGFAPAVSIESMWRTVSASGGVWVDASAASGTWTEV